MPASRLDVLKLTGASNADAFDAHALPCPICDNQMSLQSETSLPPRDGVDFTLRALRCDDCGMTSGLAFNPAFGYDRKATATMRFSP